MTHVMYSDSFLYCVNAICIVYTVGRVEACAIASYLLKLSADVGKVGTVNLLTRDRKYRDTRTSYTPQSNGVSYIYTCHRITGSTNTT